MIIWILMAVALVVIFIVTFVGRRRYGGSRSGSSEHHATHTTNSTHHGKNARNHRGRGSH